MTQNSIDLAKQIVTLLKDAPRPTQIAALHVARTLLSEAELPWCTTPLRAESLP